MKRSHMLSFAFLFFGGCTCSLPPVPQPVQVQTPVATATPAAPVHTARPTEPPTPMQFLDVEPNPPKSGEKFTAKLCGYASYELLNLYVEEQLLSKMKWDPKLKCHTAFVSVDGTSEIFLNARRGMVEHLAGIYLTPLKP